MPELNGYLRPMQASADYVEANKAELMAGAVAAIMEDLAHEGAREAAAETSSACRERRTAFARALSITRLTLLARGRPVRDRRGPGRRSRAMRAGPLGSLRGSRPRGGRGVRKGGMSDQDRNGLRALIGRLVHVDLSDGREVEGTLLNVNRRTIWMVEGDEDWFIPLDDVAAFTASQLCTDIARLGASRPSSPH